MVHEVKKGHEIDGGAILLPNLLPKRGGEGIPGDREFQDFSNLLISIYVYEGSNPTLSATQSRVTDLVYPGRFFSQELADF
jgi:hypothetical protein